MRHVHLRVVREEMTFQAMRPGETALGASEAASEGREGTRSQEGMRT